MIKFVRLAKKIAAATGIKETDDEYYILQLTIDILLERGRTEEEILTFYLGDEAA